MLRVDEKYNNDQDYDPHYFVNFHFNPEGSFRNAEITVNLFRENELNVTETILSLDPETIAAEIDAQYRHATE